jgi:exosortase/archaeosortase family protein
MNTRSIPQGANLPAVQPLLALLSLAIIAAPLGPWYLARLHDEAEEPLGLLALTAALIMLWPQRKQLSLRLLPLLVGSAALLTLRFCGLASFPMLLGLFVIATLACSLRPFDAKPGVVALAVLSLPLMESLDFFGGYPLRLTAAEIARSALNFFSMEVMRAGSLLRDGMNLIGVDPPCAGIRMLWTGWFVAALLSARGKLNTVRTVTLLVATTLFVVLGNSLRAFILFFPESGRVHWPHWTHEAVGLAVHGLILWAVLEASQRLADRCRTGKIKRTNKPDVENLNTVKKRIVVTGAFAALALAACLLPARSQAGPMVIDDNWPATMDGISLEQQPMTEREQRFARGFPGSVAGFRCGDRQVILRKVNRATRTLHSSAECLRASGFIVRHRPVQEDEDGRIWGCFSASDGNQKWLVRERITSRDASGSFTDASAWIWNALVHPERGPWLAVTVMSAAT